VMMRLGRSSRLAVLALALLLVCSGVAVAQRTAGEIRGTVYDASGAIVASASVTITNQDTGATTQRAADAKGEFVFPLLQPGNYQVQVTAANFKKYVKSDVAVRALETVSVTPKLEVGRIEEAIAVKAELEPVNVSSGGVAQRLSKEVLAEFPNLNRYGFSNATLLPGVSQYEERRETLNASVAGNATNRNSFYIDGAEATDPWRGWSPRQPIADAFEEIVVSTAGATPDTGSNFGGTYNAAFKAGTNVFRGGAWYYFRDKSLNANSWGNNYSGLKKPNDPLKYWGAQIGGPIMKDRLFFYTTMSRETDQTPYTTQRRYAPTQAMIQGDFSAVPYTIYNPDTGAAFPGNQIPSSMIDPVAKAFWDKYGYSIGSYSDSYAFGFANERKVWNFNGRVDYKINEHHGLTLSGYYFVNKTLSPDARVQSISGSSTGGVSGNTFGEKAKWNELSEFPQTVLNAKHTWMVKPNLFIETHGSWSQMPEKVVMDEASKGTTLSSLGATDPAPRAEWSELLPNMIIGDWWGSQAENAVLFHGWTTDFTVKNITVGTSTTWISGSHNVKVGAEFQAGNFRTIKPAGPGEIYFNGNATSKNNTGQGSGAPFAYGFADFLLGRYDNYATYDGSDQTLKSRNTAAYVMDQWRITPRLTLTPGLRLELNSGITETTNSLTMYRPGLKSTTLPNAPLGVVVAGDAGLPNSFTGSFFKVGPRMNAAYDLTGDGKTAIRGSAGLYYGRDVLALYETGFMRKPPFTGATANARNGRLSNPWTTSQNPTYSAPPFPFTDQNPTSYSWPSQVSGLYGLDPNYDLAASWQWNMAVEREVLKGIRLELSYQGNSSTNSPTQVPSNLPVFAAGANTDSSNMQLRRPNQFLGDNGPTIKNDGRSRYDQVLLIGRVRRSDMYGQLSWAYTHGRRNFGGTNQQGNRDWDTGILIPDQPELMADYQNNQSIGGYVMWNLPILKDNQNALGKILGGWTLTADGYFSFANKGQSFYPGWDVNANNWGDDYADVKGTISYPKTALTGQGDKLYQWIKADGLAYPGGVTSGQFANVRTFSGLNAVNTLPTAWMVNAAVLKNFRLTGRAKIQARIEAYNVFNHANLNGPNTTLNSSDFGLIRGKYGEGRRIQLGARLSF
jgi:hypothetical protein